MDRAAQLAQPAAQLWPALARQIREAILAFQRIVATRNDLGTLASMNIKLARLGLERLRLAIEEFLGEQPELEAVYQEVRRPASEAPRVIVPTRPTWLRRGETVAIQAIAAGEAEPVQAELVIRDETTGLEERRLMCLLGRRTYAAELGPYGCEGVRAYRVEVRYAGLAGAVRSVGEQPLLVGE